MRCSGNLAISGSLQSISVWNLRQAHQIAAIDLDNSNYPYHTHGTLSQLARSGDRSTIAGGYSSGEVVIVDYISKTILATLRGHRAPVQALAYDPSGSLLASGGADTDIFIWDVVNLAGRCKLRGHKDTVTGCAFIPGRGGVSGSGSNFLVSVSKDTYMRVWDMATQSCIQTIVGHRCEIWSLTVCTLPESEDQKMEEPASPHLLLTGSADDLLRGYRVRSGTGTREGVGDEEHVLEYCGSVQCTGEKCADLQYCESLDCVVAITGPSSKSIEMFRLRDSAETKKKLKRRLKREKDRKLKGQEDVEESSAVDELLGGPLLGDMLEMCATCKSSHKFKSIAISPLKEKDRSHKFLVSTANNSFEVYRITAPSLTGHQAQGDQCYTLAKQSVLEMHGHRSDVRASCVTSDGLQIATCSAEGMKVWSTKTLACVVSCPTDYGVSMAYVTGNRYVIVGSKEGKLQVVDTASGEICIEEEHAHEGAIWSISLQPPDGKGFATGGADKLVKFWDFTVNKGVLGIELSRQLVMTHDVMSLTLSNSPVARGASVEKQLVAIGLLDHTVKVFYNDSLKFYLSLYGHKLPVMCLDISSDSQLLVSGSADKTIKIWGLDFGDCHRSLLGHEDSVTSIKFQPDTHYFFSCGKDGAVKYWDADRFEQIQYLPGHISSAWSLSVSPDASYVVSCGQDRSIRVWERTEDLVFVEEERERALEAQVEASMEQREQHDAAAGNTDGAGVAALPSIESLKSGERVMEALQLVEVELARSVFFTGDGGSGYRPSVLLMGKLPVNYMAWTLREGIKSADLEMALLVIPFHMVHRLMYILLLMSRVGMEVEICARSVIFLLRCHHPRILSTLGMGAAGGLGGTVRVGETADNEGFQIPALPDIIEELKDTLRSSVLAYRDMMGRNLAALKHMARDVEAKRSMNQFLDEVPDDRSPRAVAPTKKRKKSQGYVRE